MAKLTDVPASKEPLKGNETTQEIEQLQELQNSLDSKKNIPEEFIPIHLPSNGRLDLPKTIHVRNFTTEEVLEIGMQIDEVDKKVALIKVLKDLIHEPIREELLTESDLSWIMYTISYTFYSEDIENVYPLKNEDIQYLEENSPELALKVKQGKHSFTVVIPRTLVKTIEATEKLVEPFMITDHLNRDFYFRYPRLNDTLLAKEYIEKEFEEADNEIQAIENKISNEVRLGIFDPSITKKERNIYDKYLVNKSFKLMTVVLKLLLVKVGKKNTETLADKFKYAKQIDHTTWQKASKYLRETYFGIDPRIKVKSPITGKKEIRRFSFRPLDIFTKLSVSGDDEDDLDIMPF